MPTYAFEAMNSSGQEVKDEIDASTSEEAIAKMKPAETTKVNLFASEEQWPELIKPVQMAWDTKGRLWVAVWHNYQVAPRGLHMGVSPLQRSGIIHQETDWLLVLGYVPLVA